MPIYQFTGLSGAGKTTLAEEVASSFNAIGTEIVIIDGDVYRKTICKDLGFSMADRQENIRRLGAEAYKHSLQNRIVIISAINPFEMIRQELTEKYGAKTIYINCAMNTLKARDTKGLYKRALLPEGHPDKLLHFTGISDTYEAPIMPDLEIHTDLESKSESAQKIFNFILQS